MRRLGVILLFVCFFVMGCGSKWTSDTFLLTSDPFFDLKLTTTDCLSYNLTVTNKTQKDVEIVWDKTQFIDQTNSTSGGFMFGNEVSYDDRDRTKAPTIVFANDSLTKNLYPASLAYWKRGWRNGYLPAGRSGVYLTLRSGGEEMKHRLYVNIVY